MTGSGSGAEIEGGQVDKLTFRTEPEQLRRLAILLIFISVLVTVGVLPAFLKRGHGPTAFWVVFVSLIALLVVWVYVMYALAFTECTPVGIRTLGLAGLRKCSWPQVADIRIRHGVYMIRTVKLTTVDGRQFMLGAPVDGGVMAHPGFDEKVGRIQEYGLSVK